MNIGEEYIADPNKVLWKAMLWGRMPDGTHAMRILLMTSVAAAAPVDKL